MVVFDVFPTVIPVITLPYKPYEISTTDWGYGSEKAIIYKVVSDFALGSEVLLELNLPVFDASIGSDFVVEHLAINSVLDLGSTYELISYSERLFSDEALATDLAKILFLMEDQATTLETVIEFGAFIFTVDISTALDTRLSPVPVRVLDEALSYDVLTEFQKILVDYGEGIEIMWFNILAEDVATSLDALSSLISYVVRVDYSLATEERLSPIPIITDDLSSGLENISGWNRPIGDYGVGDDYSMLGYLVEDDSYGAEFISELNRGVIDVSSGAEKRLSPIPLKELDDAYGYDVGYLVYREYLTGDEGVGVETINYRLTSFTDFGVGYERSYIMVSGKDTAKTFETIIFRLFERFDFTEAFEKRLSPIPWIRADTSKGYEFEMLNKPVDVFDTGIGVEEKEIRIPLPPKYEDLSANLTLNVFETDYMTEIIYENVGIRFARSLSANEMLVPMRTEFVVTTIFKFTDMLERADAIVLNYELNLNKIFDQSESNIVFPIDFSYKVDLNYEKIITPNVIISMKKAIQIPIEIKDSTYKAMRNFVFSFEKLSHAFGKVVHLSEQYVSKQKSKNELIINDRLTVGSDVAIEYLTINNDINVNIPVIALSIGTVILDSTIDERIIQIYKKSVSGVRIFYHETDFELYPIYLNSIKELTPYTIKVSEDIFRNLRRYVINISPYRVVSYENIIRGFRYVTFHGVCKVKLPENIIKGLNYIIYRYLESYKYLVELMAFLPNIRYVSYGDPVLPEDINVFKDAFELFVKFAETLYYECFAGDKEVRDYMYKLKETLSKFREVKLFEFVLARHRNQIVDLIMRAREFLEVVWKKM